MWDNIVTILEKYGLFGGTFFLFWIFANWYFHKQYNDRLKDKQNEIDRLAADIKDYRDRFLHFLDDKLDYKPKDDKNKQIDKKDSHSKTVKK